MLTGLWDRLRGKPQPPALPHFTLTRLPADVEVTGRSPRYAFRYEIPRADNYLQFRVACMLDLLNDSWTGQRVEAVLRDLLRFTTVREHRVVVRTEEWEGEFRVRCNPVEAGTLLVVIHGRRPGGGGGAT
jgi:hypothetical protein